jgi:WD40 repeat protein/serine/threonine protein kinase
VPLSRTEVLVFVDGREIARHLLGAGAHTFGSAVSCSIQIQAARVCAEHARLTIGEDGSLILEDLGSPSGTFLDGFPISAPTPVAPDQSFQIGTAKLLILQHAADPEAGEIPAELSQLARYELGAEIARGGMGSILAARQPAIRREVALKLMLRNAGAHDRLRFIEEAQITGQLEHPNIVPVHDLALNEHGQPYYTMKLVKGRTLQDVLKLLREGSAEAAARYPLAALLTIFQKVCDAVAFAHARGVIHRDLKPANIMVGEYGEVLVMDWGLAKIIGGGGSPSQPATPLVGTARADQRDVFATMDGAVMGTPRYMSPEQARGEIATLDQRSDVFSLGAILYELVTLLPPFPGKTHQEVLSNIISGNLLRPNARLRATDSLRSPHLPGGVIPDSLEAVISKALALDRKERYQQVAEFQADLTAYQGGFATGAENARAWKQFTLLLKRHKALSTAIAGSVLLIAAISAGFTFKVVAERDRAEREKGRAQRQTANAEAARDELARKQLELEAKNAEAKRMLAETAQSDRANARECMRQERYGDALAYLARACEYAPESSFAAEQAVAMANEPNFRHPSLRPPERVENRQRSGMSADGKRRTTILKNEARLVEVGTGKLIRALSGHTREIYVARFNADGTRIVTASGDGTARIWNGLTGEPIATLPHGDRTAVYRAAFSPDGTRVVTGSSDSLARIWDVATGEMKTELSGHTGRVYACEFSPDGRRIVTGSADRTARVWEAARGDLIIALPPGNKEIDFDGVLFSADGQYVMTENRHDVEIMWDTAGHAPAVFGGSTPDAQFSPDGSRIVTADHKGSVWDVASGQLDLAISGTKASFTGARFSPDGTRIVTTSMDNTASLWDAATGQSIATLSGHEERVFGARFSADGASIVTRSSDGSARIWEGRTGRLVASIPPVPAAKASEGNAELSDVEFDPSGTRIVAAYQSPNIGRVFDARTGGPIVALSGDTGTLFSAEFSRDGGRIVISSDEAAWVWDAITRNVVFKLDHRGPENFGRTTIAKFSPDGTRILTACDDRAAWMWDAAKGTLLARLVGHLKGINSAEFDIQGTRILTAGDDGTARIWEASTGRPIVTLGHESIEGHSQRQWTAHFSPSGNQIITIGGGVRLWDLLGTTEPPPKWFSHFLKTLGGRSLNEEGEPAALARVEWQAYLDEVSEALKSDTSRYGAVARYFLTAGPARPTHPGSLKTYGEVADAMISATASKGELESAYNLDPVHPLIHLALARDESNSIRAAFLLDYDLTRLPGDPALWARAVRALQEQHDDARTRQALQKLEKLAPETAAMLRKELAL